MGTRPVKFCKIHKIPISGITGKCKECEKEENEIRNKEKAKIDWWEADQRP